MKGPGNASPLKGHRGNGLGQTTEFATLQRSDDGIKTFGFITEMQKLAALVQTLTHRRVLTQGFHQLKGEVLYLREGDTHFLHRIFKDLAFRRTLGNRGHYQTDVMQLGVFTKGFLHASSSFTVTGSVALPASFVSSVNRELPSSVMVESARKSRQAVFLAVDMNVAFSF